MKIQEVFNEYIELLPYMVSNKHVFVIEALYDSYIKKALGDKDLSILCLTDYQEFANNLLSIEVRDSYMSRDRINSIMEVLISINRYAIKSEYHIKENLAQKVKLTFDLTDNPTSYKEDFELISKELEFFNEFSVLFQKIEEVRG